MTANWHSAQLPLVLHMFDNNDGAISIIEIEFDYLIFKLCYYYSLSCSRIKLFQVHGQSQRKKMRYTKKSLTMTEMGYMLLILYYLVYNCYYYDWFSFQQSQRVFVVWALKEKMYGKRMRWRASWLPEEDHAEML